MCIHFYYTVTSFEEKKKTALNYCPCSYRDSERDRFGTTYQRVVTVKLHGDSRLNKRSYALLSCLDAPSKDNDTI